MTQPTAIREFIDLVIAECPEAQVEIDAPRDPKGEWLVDIRRGKFRTSVAWRKAEGFGLFTGGEAGFGERPDELFQHAQGACTRVCQLLANARSGHAHRYMMLRELRHLVGTSQVDLAQALHINQAAVSRLEGREDMHLSSLFEYIEAMGGELELRAKFDQFEARIDPTSVIKQRAQG